MGGGGGIPIVDDALDFVGDVVEGAGDVVGDVFDAAGDAFESVGDAVGDALSWVDKNVLKPLLDDPIKTIATIAAVATGNPQLVPYINAADAAAKGGSFEDIGKAYAISYVAGQAGGKVGGTVAGETGSQVAGNIAKGATRGALTAGLSGGDATKGALLGGAVAGAGEVVNVVKEAFKDEPAAPTITLEEAKPLGGGITPGTTGEGFEPLKSSAPGVTATPFEPSTSSGDFSLVAPTPTPTPTFATEGEQQYEVAPTRPTTPTGQIDYGIDSEKVELLPTPDKDLDWNAVGNKILKDAQKALGKTLLESLFPTPTPAPRRTGDGTASYELGDAASAASATVGLQEVGVSKYDLKTFENEQGNRINIPFKDDEPQMPIPSGYSEVKMAKGGLAKKRKTVVKSATNMSKTRKGLAAQLA